MTTKQQQGKKNKKAGAEFEKRVRADLEKRDWVVDRWTNNIELHGDLEGANNIWGCKSVIKGKIVPAKPKFMFNPKTRVRQLLGLHSGFPDFIAFRRESQGMIIMPENTSPEQLDEFAEKYSKTNNQPSMVTNVQAYRSQEIIGVEVKINGTLDKEEKEKCRWYLDRKVFSKILIAYKVKEGRRVVVKYKEFNAKKMP